MHISDGMSLGSCFLRSGGSIIIDNHCVITPFPNVVMIFQCYVCDNWKCSFKLSVSYLPWVSVLFLYGIIEYHGVGQ